MQRNVLPKVILFFITVFGALQVFGQTTNVNFNYTGGVQSFTVPACVTTLTITARGAQGGSNGGLGAVVTGTMSVVPGQVIQIRVGGQGACPGAGYNGGGSGAAGQGASCGGGGATDVRITPYGLGNRVIVAAGGGGRAGGSTASAGGNGGCATGTAGVASFGIGGGGGSLTAGGGGGAAWGSGALGQAGSLGQGGNGAADPCYTKGPGGGGGGGYYGGGGGGSDCYNSPPLGGGGGGGGSSLTPGGGTCTAGNNIGNGSLVISYAAGSLLAGATNTGPYCAGATIQLNSTPAGGTAYNWSGPNSYTANVQNPSIANSTTAMSGVYTVTVTAVGGCTTTATTTVTVNAAPVLTATNTGPYCPGNTIQLNATGATTYSWTGPPAYTGSGANPTIANATTAMTGTYVLTGTVGTCTATTSTSVTVNPTPTVTATNTGPYCPGAAIQLNSGGATTYSWTGPSTFTSSAQNPSPGSASATTAGIYTVTGTSNNCTATATTTVTVGTPPAPILSSNSPICEGATLMLDCANGSSWSWIGPNGFSSSLQNPTITGATPLASGTYSVTITDTQGCATSGTINVTVNPLPVVTVNSDSICLGQATATLTANGATGYSWSAGTTPATGATVTADPVVTTSYVVTGTDVNGCQSTATATITVFTIPNVTVNSTAICNGSTATLTAAGANTYAWTAGTTPSTGASVAVTPTATTQYTVTGTDVNGCVASAVSTVTVNYSPVFDAGANDTVCAGDMVNLAATGAANATYTWNPGNMVGQTQSFVAATSTTYTLVCVDANGCTGTDSVSIVVPAPIVLNVAGFATTCNGSCDGQLVVIPTPSTGPFSTYTYNWMPGNYSTASVITACADNYTVTVTNNAGCTATATTTVTEPAPVTANSTGITPATCNGACNGSVTINANGGTGTYSYAWSSLGSGNNPSNLCAGNYTCTVSDANSCSDTVQVAITQPAVISVAINPVNTICIGQTASLTANASGGNGGYVYTWTGGTTPVTGASVSASPTATSLYSVSVTDVNGCPPGAANVTVTVNPPLSVVASSDVTICAGQSTSLNAAAIGGDGGFVYTWTGGPNPATGQTITTTPPVTAVYTVTLTDGCGTPAATDMVTVTVNQLPVLGITVSPLEGCAPVIADFTATSTPAATSVSWTFTDNQTATTNPTATITFTVAGTYGATINVTDVNGCQNTYSDNNLITVHPVPIPLFSFNPQPATVANPIITFTDESFGATIVDWNWTFGNPGDSSSTEQNPMFAYENAGSYDVWLTVTSDEGCMDSIRNVVVIDPEFLLYVPNAFSPNGDGINDTFFPKGVGILTDQYEIWIYDRWGNMIYSENDWTRPWDGKVNGNTVPEDVYVWKIKLKSWDNEKKFYVGHVTVVK